MVGITEQAQAQYQQLVQWHLGKDRPQAARNLEAAYDAAVERIESSPAVFLAFPRPYPSLARYNFRWIKEHRYWFAFVDHEEHGLVITNVFDETADMPGRISEDDEPADEV